jgi:hypothetical protein
MAISLYVPGPTEISVALGPANSLQFLGFTRDGVQVTHQAEFEDVMCDVSGPRIPFDNVYLGEQIFVQGVLQVYNEPLFEAVARRVQTGKNTTTEHPLGTIYGNTIGTLMKTEGAFCRLLLRSMYASKAVYRTAGMRPAYYVPFCWLEGAYDVGLGPVPKAIRFVFRGVPNWTLAYSQAGSVNAGALFSADMTGAATPPLSV